jgi:tRNA pseudouridine13 synthase
LLAFRVADSSWNTLVPGDVANLDGSGSVFDIDVLDEALQARCRMLDIHPTAVLWGDGADTDAAPPGRHAWLSALARARVQPARRSLRLKVLDLQWQPGEDSLTLEFGLTRGAFATSVIRELATVTDFASHNESEESQHEPP